MESELPAADCCELGSHANYIRNASRHIWGSTYVNSPFALHGATTGNTNQRRLTSLVNPTLGQYYGDIQQTDDGGNAEYLALYL